MARSLHGSIGRRPLLLERLEQRVVLSASPWGSPEVPEFNSLPSAEHTIFLDFNGHLVEQTSWNRYYDQTSLDAPPYDLDGNPGQFNDKELAKIEEVWQRVAEDFAPFQVNVTTVDPGAEALSKSGLGDTAWGIRVVITDEGRMVDRSNERCGCGGIAYVNSFNWRSDTPVWVYNGSGKGVAEAASHEIGHSLGLSHDGQESGSTYYSGHGAGQTSWAPLMGVGYARNVTQWDQGEYRRSNNDGSNANYGAGPDDLAVITTTNGFGYRVDDHGDTNSAASMLGLSGDSVTGLGIIERSDDTDVWSFITGEGDVVLNIEAFRPGPNLDVNAQLFDASGTLIASSNPAERLDATLELALDAGQYFLHLDGVGIGDPGSNPPTGYTDYATLGQYQISGTIVAPAAAPGLTISDVTVDESDGEATFIVTVSGQVTRSVSVEFTTADGSALVDLDYAATSGTLTFEPGGDASQSIRVPIVNDQREEPTENFVVDLFKATGAVILDGQGVGTITDSDLSTRGAESGDEPPTGDDGLDDDGGGNHRHAGDAPNRGLHGNPALRDYESEPMLVACRFPVAPDEPADNPPLNPAPGGATSTGFGAGNSNPADVGLTPVDDRPPADASPSTPNPWTPNPSGNQPPITTPPPRGGSTGTSSAVDDRPTTSGSSATNANAVDDLLQFEQNWLL